MQARLITIPFSHYCEKARWVLDATGVDYREESHAPMIHRRATRAVGAKTVPVLVHGDRVLRDSTEIAIYADNLAAPERRLIPADAAERARVLDLENEIDETLGVDARLIAYSYLLGDAETARTFVERGIKVRTRFAQAIVAWLFRGLIFRRYQVTAERARHAENRVRDLFARLGETLERQPYLVGSRLTLADVTLAALSGPLLTPPEHPVTPRKIGTAPPGLAALRDELEATPTGRHIMRVYREHRGPSNPSVRST